MNLEGEAIQRILEDKIKAHDLPNRTEVGRIVEIAINESEQRTGRKIQAMSEEYFTMLRSIDAHLRGNEASLGNVKANVAELRGSLSTLPQTVSEYQSILMRHSETLVRLSTDQREIQEALFGDKDRPDVASLVSQIASVAEGARMDRQNTQAEILVIKAAVARWQRYEEFAKMKLLPFFETRKGQMLLAGTFLFFSGRIGAPQAMDNIGNAVTAILQAWIGF